MNQHPQYQVMMEAALDLLRRKPWIGWPVEVDREGNINPLWPDPRRAQELLSAVCNSTREAPDPQVGTAAIRAAFDQSREASRQSREHTAQALRDFAGRNNLNLEIRENPQEGWKARITGMYVRNQQGGAHPHICVGKGTDETEAVAGLA